MFTITFDAAAVLKRLALARKLFARAIVQAVARSARFAAQRARKGDFKNRTGALRRSIQPVISNYEATVDATAPQAFWVERGNKSRFGDGYIYPKNGPFLRFKIDGRRVVARRVRTSKPRLFMQHAAEEAKPFFEGLCLDAALHLIG